MEKKERPGRHSERVLLRTEPNCWEEDVEEDRRERERGDGSCRGTGWGGGRRKRARIWKEEP